MNTGHGLNMRRRIEETPKGTPRKIIVLDDEESVRKSIDLILKKDYRTFLAENGKEAMEILKREDIDLIITDIELAEENGLDVMEQVLQSNRGIKFVVVSSTLDDKTVNRAIKMGAKGILDKPFRFVGLESLVRGALSE